MKTSQAATPNNRSNLWSSVAEKVAGILAIFISMLIARYIIRLFQPEEPPPDTTTDTNTTTSNDVAYVNIEKLSSRSTGNVREDECRTIVESLFGITAPNSRYPIFRNPKTGRMLEIDVAVPSLMFGLEYQGQQHYRPCYGVTEEQVQQQQARDKIKVDLCKQYGWDLMVVPYDKQSDLRHYITTNLPARLSPYVTSP